jgi:TolB-like protein
MRNFPGKKEDSKNVLPQARPSKTIAVTAITIKCDGKGAFMAITAKFAKPVKPLVQCDELPVKPIAKQALHSPEARLDSWKEIAAYLKRSVRAVSRWERQEGLPVHRHHHGKQGTVYALPHELDAWLQSRSGQDQACQPAKNCQAISLPEPGFRSSEKGPLVIAVLPLRNLSDGPDGERFADGLTEELISEIGHCCPHQLRVIALTSAMQYKRSSKTIEEIGKELRVHFILEGSIQRFGDRVRLTARAIAVRDQAHIWADTYEIQLPPIFSLQQSLAQQVADSVSAEFRLANEKKRFRFALPSFAAHSAYLEAKSHLLPTQADTMKNLEQLSLAIESDPTFAPSYADLALTYFRRLIWDFPPVITLKRIEENAHMALELDSKLARAHSMLAAFHLMGNRSWPNAIKQSRMGLDLNPSDAWGRLVRAACCLVAGKQDELTEVLKQVPELDPHSVETCQWFAHVAFMAQRHDLAIEYSQKVLQLGATSAFVHLEMGMNLAKTGEYALALCHCEKARLLGASTIMLMSKACSIYALAGQVQKAESLYEDLLTAREIQYTRYIFLAHAAACLRKEQETLEWLNKAYEQRDPLLVFLKTDPRFETMADLPEFADLLKRIGLPDQSDDDDLAMSA